MVFQAEDDIIGKRMGLVREALLQRILDESSDSLFVSVQAWSYKEEAALAAAKRFFACIKFLDVEGVALETNLKSCRQVKPYDLYHNIGARSLCDRCITSF